MKQAIIYGAADRKIEQRPLDTSRRNPLALFRWTLLGFVITCQLAWMGNARGQGIEAKNPYAHDQAALKKGGTTYRVNCDFCHGVDARGENGAPDLTAPRTQRRSDAEIFRIILGGRPGTEMPANDLSEKETWQVIAYLRSLRPASSTKAAGEPEAGRKIFLETSACSQCHMVNGKGGRLGPDLTRIAISRSTTYLVESIREPSKVLAIAMMPATRHETPVRYQTVTVVTKDGRRFSGVRKNEDSFSVQLMTQDEQLHTFFKEEVSEVIHEQTSLMPQYSEAMLSEKDLRDLLAFLESLAGR
jgi:putative heme-binding domain-containing protein